MHSVFSALRVYVLSRSKPLGLLIAALSLAPVGANMVSEWMFIESCGRCIIFMGIIQVPYGYQYSGENLPPFGCLTTANISVALDLRFASFNRIRYIGTDYVLYKA